MKKRNKLIFICDDNEDIVEPTSILLKEEGYEVKSFNQTKNLESEVSKAKPDLILMDLKLPDRGGLEVTKNLKKDPETAEIPIVLFSADREIKEKTIMVGGDGFIEKPFEFDRLLKLIKKLAYKKI